MGGNQYRVPRREPCVWLLCVLLGSLSGASYSFFHPCEFLDDFLQAITGKADRQLRVIAFPFTPEHGSTPILCVDHSGTGAKLLLRATWSGRRLYWLRRRTRRPKLLLLRRSRLL